MKARWRCYIITIFMAWNACRSAPAAAVFVKITDAIKAQRRKTLFVFLLCSWSSQCRECTAGCHHIRPRCRTMCGLDLGQSCGAWTQPCLPHVVWSHLLRVYIPCWAALLVSDSPSICLSRLKNGKKNIWFPWRWWPTAVTEKEHDHRDR